MIAQTGAAELSRPGPLRIHAVFWNALGPGSLANALMEMLDNMPAERVERRLWCLRNHPDSHVRREYHSPIFPELLYRAFCKARLPARVQGRLGSPITLSSIRAGDIVYVWPDFDLPLIERAQDRGAIVVAERTNVMAPMGLEALSRAYERRGIRMPHGWFDPEEMELERRQMKRCDYVVARNSFVSQSLRDVGVPQDRIIEGAYGFNPQRLAPAIGLARPERPPVFGFVGAGIIGKGLDVLLEAWVKANVKGTLMLAGELDPDIMASYAHVLAREDVKVLGFVREIARVYAAADVFVFPSHAEGGPQVVYEAAGCGLPSIISPMGAGRIVRDGLECLFIDPLNVDELAAAITKLAEDETLRRDMGEASSKRAREFTWAKVGEQLYRQFSVLRPRGPG